MPRPEGQGLRQNFVPRLTTMAIGYLPDMNQFIGRRMFPNLTVGAQSFEYNIFPRGEWLRPQGKKLANAEAAPLGGFKFDKGLGSVDEYGVAANWTNRDLNNAEVGGISSVQLKNMKTLFVTFQAVLALEIDMANLVRTDANWTLVKTGVASAPSTNQFLQWNDPASDPVSNVKAWKLEMLLSVGQEPNRFQITQEILNALSEHPDIIDRVKYTGTSDSPAKVNLQSIQALFEIDNMTVPKSVQNTAQEGAADAIAFIWGKDAFLYFAPDAPSIEQPSAAYRFSWGAADGYTGPQPFGRGVNAEGLYIANYVTNRPSAEWVESRWYTVPKVTGAGLGIRLKTVVA
jgi:hypothetical protein